MSGRCDRCHKYKEYQGCVKGQFHELTNQDDERDKTADGQKKLIGVTELIGRATSFVWSFHGTVVIAFLVADQLNFFNVFYKTGRQPERHRLPFVGIYMAPRPSNKFFLVGGRISLISSHRGMSPLVPFGKCDSC